MSLLSFNCTKKEESCTTDNYLINNSIHTIEINYYSNGMVQDAEKVELMNNESKNVFNNFTMGKGNSFPYGKMISFFDSAIIQFDDTIKTTHYSFNVDTTGKKGLGFYNLRNLFNTNNYLGGKTSETKYSDYYSYKFIFTEQDYLNAKK